MWYPVTDAPRSKRVSKRYRLAATEYKKIERWDNLCQRLEVLGVHRSNETLEECIGAAVDELLALRDEKKSLNR